MGLLGIYYRWIVRWRKDRRRDRGPSVSDGERRCNHPHFDAREAHWILEAGVHQFEASLTASNKKMWRHLNSRGDCQVLKH